MPATVRLNNNTWAHSFGPVEGVEWSHTWARGCEQASWQTRAGAKSPALRVGARAEVHQGAGSTWVGRVSEIGRDGKIVATGLWRQGEQVLAVDGSGVATFDPDVAVDAAIAAGQVWWRRVGTLGDPITPDDPDKPIYLTALLDACMGDTGDVWRVGGHGNISRESRPTVPSWHVAPGMWQLTPADDGFITVVRVYYLAGIGDPQMVHAFNQRDLDLFGWREGEIIDLISEGVMSGATAEARAREILDALGPRMAFTESLTLRPGELTSIGGHPSGLSSLRAGHMVRIAGVWDGTRPGAPLASVQEVIGQSRHTDTTVTISAQGQPARTLAAVLAEIANR